MIVLRGDTKKTPGDLAIKTILEALGVTFVQEIEPEELKLKTFRPITGEGDQHSTLIAPFSCLDLILSQDGDGVAPALRLPEWIKSVFFHSMDSPGSCERFLQGLLHDQTARLVEVNPKSADFVVSGKHQDISGPLTGLTIRSDEEIPCWGLVSQSRLPDYVSPLVRVDSRNVLLCIKRTNVEIFMLFTSHLADPEQPLEANIDIRHYLLSLAAPLMILKYLSQDIGWRARNNHANLIIDDPPLTLQYGHLDFRKVLHLVASHDAAFTLAFIPHNYRRKNDEAVRFFKNASDKLSICIHGCDHTGLEFGNRDLSHLNDRTRLACSRMAAFSERTGIHHTRIMVFPHGIFSSRALGVLKQHGFLAAVNTELRDVTAEKQVRLKDMLQPAVTCYEGFPLFLRRRLSDGIHNTAFDQLLGKPCLLVTHHDDFGPGMAKTEHLLDGINNLPNPPHWQPLDNIVKRTGLLRTPGNHESELKIYSNTVDLQHIPGLFNGNYLRVIKDESHPELIHDVLVGQSEVAWRSKSEFITVDVGEQFEDATLRVLYRPDDFTESRQTLKYRMAVWSKRHLREFRDDYISKFSALQYMVRWLRRISAKAVYFSFIVERAMAL